VSTDNVPHHPTLVQLPTLHPLRHSSDPSRFKYAEIGSISHGTMRTEDLLPTFLDALTDVAPGHARTIRKEYKHVIDVIENDPDAASDKDREDADYLVNEVLPDALQEHALPYTYFGSHEGDGADYGFWISWDAVDDAVRDGSILKLHSGDPWPKGTRTKYEYVLEINDHGNATLFNPRSRREVWSCV